MEKENTTIITKKMQLNPVYSYPENASDEEIKEAKKKFWDKLRLIDYWVHRIANYTSTQTWSKLCEYGNVKRGDLPKIEPYKFYSEDLCEKYPELKELKISNIATGLTKEVADKVKKEYYDYLNGKKRIPAYKSGTPFYIPRSKIKSESNGIYKSIGKLLDPKNKNYQFTSPAGKFKIYFGRDRSNNKLAIDKCRTGEYELLDSKIQYNKSKNKIYLLASIRIPVNKSNKLDENVCVGVDLGITNPITASVYSNNNLVEDKGKTYIKNNESIFIGNDDMFFYNRMKFQKTRKSIQKALKTSKGGHGRKRKLEKLDAYKKKEINWVNTQVHVFSKKLIDFCLKNNAKYIIFEDLSSLKEKKDYQKHMGRYWSPSRVQITVTNKAKKYGIITLKIDPKNTSKTCSACGHVDKENRKSQSEFECVSCGMKMNADMNATRNIAYKHISSLKK